jgi:predicted O-methyltransferase YrrM
MPKAVKFLEKKISNFHRVFEFGSGYSSIWYAEQIEDYTAVEHDQSWSTQVRNMLNDKKLTNAKILFVPTDDSGADFNWANEWPYYSILKHAPENPEYRNYISQIDQFPDKHFGLIIIDGRERLGCLVHSLTKLADGGMIIFDDSARDKYHEIFDILDGWHYKSFRFGLGQTTFFAREKSVLNMS